MTMEAAGGQPLFAADWALTEIDGERDAAWSALRPGCLWSWRGALTRLDAGPDPARGPLRLDGAVGRAELRRMAARRAARFGRRPVAQGVWSDGSGEDLALAAPWRGSFFVTDGRSAWAVTEAPGRLGAGFGVRRLVLFCGAVPPREVPLWVVSASARRGGGTALSVESAAGPGAHSPAPAAGGFAAGTAIETPFGPIPVERLRPGDPVLTDSGTAPLRRVRVRPAVPALALPPGLLGPDGPSVPLVLGDGTWLGVESPSLPKLFGEGDGSSDGLREALVRTGDLASLSGTARRPRADLIAIEVDDGPHGAAILMAGGVPCLAGCPTRAPLRCLTLGETLVALSQPFARFAPGLVFRGAA